MVLWGWGYVIKMVVVAVPVVRMKRIFNWGFFLEMGNGKGKEKEKEKEKEKGKGKEKEKEKGKEKHCDYAGTAAGNKHRYRSGKRKILKP